MENAVDALKMAAAVLIFVLALSVSIVAFGQVRQTSDVVLNYKDRETDYIEGNYYYNAHQSERTVNIETIIPTIYRAYLENYKIIFEGLQKPIYIAKKSNSTKEERYSIDSEYDNKQGDMSTGKQSFLKAIIYGKQDDMFNLLFSSKVELPSISLYDQLNSADSITEYIGVYYDEELQDEANSNPGYHIEDDEPDANKVEKRIITYKVNY